MIVHFSSFTIRSWGRNMISITVNHSINKLTVLLKNLLHSPSFPCLENVFWNDVIIMVIMVIIIIINIFIMKGYDNVGSSFLCLFQLFQYKYNYILIHHHSSSLIIATHLHLHPSQTHFVVYQMVLNLQEDCH